MVFWFMRSSLCICRHFMGAAIAHSAYENNYIYSRLYRWQCCCWAGYTQWIISYYESCTSTVYVYAVTVGSVFNFSISNIDKGDIAHMLDNKEKFVKKLLFHLTRNSNLRLPFFLLPLWVCVQQKFTGFGRGLSVRRVVQYFSPCFNMFQVKCIL